MNASAKLRTALRLLGRLDFATLRRQWTINWKQLKIRRRGGRAFVHTDLGFPSVCHPDWVDSVDFYCVNAGDHWEYRLLQAWLQPDETFLDLGTNVGFYAFAALPAVGSAGRVVAVDAAPFVIEKLDQSARLLGAPNLEAVQAAITDRDGEVTFHVCPTGFVTTEQSMRPPDTLLAQSIAITVPARTLASLQTSRQLDHRLTVVKMDIEGAEGAALAGAPDTWFGADAPLWIVEINPSALARFETSAASVIAKFPAEHFECWLLPKHPHDPRTPTQLRRAEPTDPLDDSIYYNFFALPRAARWQPRLGALQPFFPDSALIAGALHSPPAPRA
jgi:FkbM family methyltransferase